MADWRDERNWIRPPRNPWTPARAKAMNRLRVLVEAAIDQDSFEAEMELIMISSYLHSILVFLCERRKKKP